MRRLFVAGNWKMNTTLNSGLELAKGLVAEVSPGGKVTVAVCPPFPYLHAVGQAVAGSGVELGAQNAYFEKPGAFTGEVSVDMLQDVQCQYVILGHSERRHVLLESDATIARKVKAVVEAGMTAILCIGEHLADRKDSQTEAILDRQLDGSLNGVEPAMFGRLVIAYEPVWAIGTGVTATPEQAQGAHDFTRKWLARRYNSEIAEKMQILYGGSVNKDNAVELLGLPDVDGALVGGASLSVEKFLPIIRAAEGLS